ncbi:MAG TPA: hypothetical protein VM008_05260 [Phycisphaerae bacterium]|nr:hypothetical protein [Phycisphaerae bacterium]
MRLKWRAMACCCWVRVFVALVMMALCARVSLAANGDLVQGEIVSMGIGGVNGLGGKYRPGAWVPVRVRLENRSGKQIAVRLGVEQVDLDGDKVLSLGQKVILDAADVEGRDFWVYYWPRPDDQLLGAASVVVMDESGNQVIATIAAPTPKGGLANVGIPKRDPDSSQGCRWVVVLGPQGAGFASYNKAYGGTEATWVSLVDRAESMPDNALGLDGVDTIVWEAEKVRVSDVPAEFQLKAMLEWVRSGGHLIISVSSQAQEFLKGGDALRAAMPMTFTGLREVELSSLSPYFGGNALRLSTAKISQVTGTLRADAKAVSGTNLKEFVQNPLAVTGVYGRGAVTVITVDASNGDIQQGVMADEDWMGFWNQMAGWRGRGDAMIMGAELYDAKRKVADTLGTSGVPPVTMPPAELDLGANIPMQVDVTEFTERGVLVAVLFLLVYWLAAGPIGHLVLRMYKVVHWSWWVFGGTVVVATGLAGAVVMFMHLTNYDLRHRTFVLGTVNSKEITALGYYGVFAPVNGPLNVTEPDTGEGRPGLNYLAPMAVDTPDGVKPFADPQSYDLYDETPTIARPIFRSTLKKLQGRWNGERSGIDGTAEFVQQADWSKSAPLKGSLVNHSGYDLKDVRVFVHRPAQSVTAESDSNVYKADDWPAGGTLDLEKGLKPLYLGNATSRSVKLSELLNWMTHRIADSATIGVHVTGVQDTSLTPEEGAVADGESKDMLFTLFNARQPDRLQDAVRVDPSRDFARGADCTKMLYAAGAIIVGRAGDIAKSNYVPSPVPLTVNNRVLEGKGEVTFAWALPLKNVVVPQDELIRQEPAAGVRAGSRSIPPEGQ